MLERLIGQSVTISLWDRGSSDIECLGGGEGFNDPRYVIILLDVDEHWVVFQWMDTGRIIAVPVSEVVCVATDIPASTRGSEKGG